MKIALAIHGGVDRPGVEYRIIPCFMWLIERLAQRGDDVHVFMFAREPNPSTWSLRGATIHNAGRPYSRCRMLQQIIQEHRRAPFDVIQSMWSLWANLIAIIAGRLTHVPVLIYFGDGELSALPEIGYGNQLSKKSRLLFRIVSVFATRIAVQSEPMVKKARVLGISAIRAPLGIALDHWPAAVPHRRRIGEAIRLLHVGAVIAIKDHEFLLQTASILKSRGVDFRLDLIGEDIARDGAMEKRALALDLSTEVVFHGFLPHAMMRPLVERADLLVVTSRHEAGPMVLLEAAVAGVPAVGTHVGHLAEWAPTATRTVSVSDPQALAAVIALVAGNEDLRFQMAREAQQRALAENADVTTERFRMIYREIADFNFEA